MVLDKLGESLQNTLKKITGASVVDEKLVKELTKDIQRALLQADVDVQLVFDLTSNIKERALEKEAPEGITRREHIVNIVYEEMVNFLGGEGGEIDVDSKQPFKIMLVGLFGAGKTTTAGKLAKYYQKRGHNVALVQTDTWRPAAYDQLEQTAEKVGCDFYGLKEAKHPQEVWKKYEDKLQDYDIVIVDTAGRDALKDELIEELNKINRKVKADENLLVMPADIGQGASEQAAAFQDMVDVDGVVITKMDGTAKGGGALAACSITGSPVKFIGVGETIEDIEEFRPEGFVGRLLGMGDLEALLEKAQHAIDQEKAEDLGKRFLEGKFNLLDLYEQMEAMQNMGSLSKIMDMIPGFSKFDLPDNALEVQEEKMDVWRVLMDSMTKEELENPDIINAARIDRISEGAGKPASEVRALLKQYRQAKKMAEMMQGKGGNKKLQKMMDKLGGAGFNF